MTEQTQPKTDAAGCLGQALLSLLKLALVMIGLVVLYWVIATIYVAVSLQ